MYYSEIRSLLAIFDESKTSYKPSIAEQLEEKILISSIKDMIEGRDDNAELTDEALSQFKSLLAKRFELIRYTYLLYTKNTASRANQLCIRLAGALQEAGAGNRFQILMPSIKSTVSNITMTDLDDPDVKVTDFILSLKQGYFIEVEDALTTAEGEAIFYHTQRVSDDGKEVKLSKKEKNGLRNHTTESCAYYDAISKRQQLHQTKHNLGYEIQKLIDGLEKGGSGMRGEEMNAGDAANEAIIAFANVYNNELDAAQRKWLSELKVGGVKFKDVWHILSVRQNKKIAMYRLIPIPSIRRDRIKHAYDSTITCVYSKASCLRRIMGKYGDELYATELKEQSRNSVQGRSASRGLFASIPFIRGGVQSRDRLQQHTSATTDVSHTKHWFMTKLARLHEGKDKLEPDLTVIARRNFEKKLTGHLAKLDDEQYKHLLARFSGEALSGESDEFEGVLSTLADDRGELLRKSIPSVVSYKPEKHGDDSADEYYYEYYSDDSDDESIDYRRSHRRVRGGDHRHDHRHRASSSTHDARSERRQDSDQRDSSRDHGRVSVSTAGHRDQSHGAGSSSRHAHGLFSAVRTSHVRVVSSGGHRSSHGSSHAVRSHRR